MTFAFHPVFTVLIAMAPAVFAFWRGRDLLAHLDDSMLPERLLALQRRNASVVGIAIGLLLVTESKRLIWALPLLIAARMLAAYPLRKVLHNETWSVGTYLSFYIRLVVAAIGFWLFVAVAPAIAARAGTRDWILALLFGAIAIVWNARYARVFRAVLRAEPVDVPAVRTRFAELTTACGLPEVTLEQVRLRGGSFTNAVAIPSMHQRAVVVTDTLIDRFDEDEVTAILAHELAHHEHFTPARLQQANRAVWVLIAVGILLPPVVRLGALPGVVFLIWAVVIIVGLMLRMQQQQKHETESDLRAVALTGDPEALVRALTKLHLLARVPRRWEAEFERRATHPSLARRIQAIRGASGAEPVSLTEPATFAAAGSEASVTFHSNRLEWHEGALTTHAISYGSLRELRVDVRSSSAGELVAVDSASRRWTLTLQSNDLARVQSVLDVIDVHLGKPVKPASAQLSFSWTSAVTLLVLVGGISVGHMAVLFTSVLALIQPASPIAAAAGVAALAAAGFALRDRAVWELGALGGWLLVALSVSGAALAAMAFVRRSEAARGIAVKKIVVTLAVPAALGWMIVAFIGGSALDFHRAARELPSVIILTFACAGAVAFERSRRVRWGALPLALVSAVAAYAGSTDFVDRFVVDPFVASTPVIDVKTQTTRALSEFSVDFYPSSLLVSPAGEYVALTTEDADEQSTIRAGAAGGALASFSADTAAFLGEHELLLLERQPRGSMLRLVDLAGATRELWTLSVPVRWADLSIDPPSRRWRLLGQGADTEVVIAEGTIGHPAIRQSRWNVPDDRNVKPLAVSQGIVVAVEARYAEMGDDFTQSLQFPSLWSFRRAQSSLWSVSDRSATVFGTSSTDLTCHASPTFAGPATCAAFDGTRTRFFALDADTRQFTPQASLAGRVYVSGSDGSGWLNGWWENTAVVLRPATLEAIRFDGGYGDRAFQIAIGDNVVAGIFPEAGTFTIRIHPAMRRDVTQRVRRTSS